MPLQHLAQRAGVHGRRQHELRVDENGGYSVEDEEDDEEKVKRAKGEGRHRASGRHNGRGCSS